MTTDVNNTHELKQLHMIIDVNRHRKIRIMVAIKYLKVTTVLLDIHHTITIFSCIHSGKIFLFSYFNSFYGYSKKNLNYVVLEIELLLA